MKTDGINLSKKIVVNIVLATFFFLMVFYFMNIYTFNNVENKQEKNLIRNYNLCINSYTNLSNKMKSFIASDVKLFSKIYIVDEKNKMYKTQFPNGVNYNSFDKVLFKDVYSIQKVVFTDFYNFLVSKKDCIKIEDEVKFAEFISCREKFLILSEGYEELKLKD